MLKEIIGTTTTKSSETCGDGFNAQREIEIRRHRRRRYGKRFTHKHSKNVA